MVAVILEAAEVEKSFIQPDKNLTLVGRPFTIPKYAFNRNQR